MKTSYKIGCIFSFYIAFFLMSCPQLLKAQKLDWAAVMGGNEGSSGKDIAMDNAGNVFSVGWYSAGQLVGSIPADFDPGPGQVLFSQSGNYLSKLNANGTFGFVKRFANSVVGGVVLSQIALDSVGNIFLTGRAYGTADVDPGTQTVMYTDSTNGNDLIVYKFSLLGIMQWYKIWPISSIINYEAFVINELELDHNGNLILVGQLYGEIDFDLGANTASAAGYPSFPTSFLLKLDENGNYLWDYTIDLNINSSLSNSMSDCAINNQNEIYVVGDFGGSINFFSPDTITLTTNGFYDAFILKISETGTLQWAKCFGGGSGESASDIHYSNDGNFYIAASYDSPSVVLANDTNSLVMLGDSINSISALIKMNESGNYEWFRLLKNANLQQNFVNPVAIETDSIGQVYFMNVGQTGTTYTNYGIDSSAVYTSGETCSFVNKYTADGTFIRSSAATGDNRIFALSMAMDKNASIAFTGEFNSRAYIVNDPNPNPIDADPDTSHFSIFSAYGTGVQGIFVIKWNQCNASTTTIDTTVCNSFNLNGNNYAQSGTYNFYETTANRCDSNAVINLTINFNQELSQNIQICSGETFSIGNQNLTQSGVYQSTLTAQNGCDSLVTTNLTIDTLNAAIVLNNNVFTSLNIPQNTQLQWLNCDDNFALLTGETNPTFTASSSGNYALETSSGNCRDTSNCVLFSSVGIHSITSNQLKVYPIPADKTLIIESGFSKSLIRIFDAQGRLVFETTTSARRMEIDVSLFQSGLYFIRTEYTSQPFTVMNNR